MADATLVERDALAAARGNVPVGTSDVPALQRDLAQASALPDPPDPQVALSWSSGVDQIDAAVQSLEAAGDSPRPGTALTAAGQLETAVGDLGSVLAAT